MRTIKFRAWDKEKKWMFFCSELKAPDMNDLFMEKEGCDLMQFTGVKDKNGKEIYEGDVVGHGEGFGSQKRLVKFLEGHFFPVGAESGCGCCSEEWPPNNVEIIGNIYENPELLNK